MDIPPIIHDSVFEKEFKRGVVLLTNLHFKRGETKSKYIIVLNKHPSDSKTLLFLTTSKIEFYNQHPEVKDFVRIQPRELSFFPLETIIDCRNVWSFPRTELSERYRQNLVHFVGTLTLEIMDQIDQLVASSRLISMRDKKIILGWK
ncbi:MAG: hypothetical protein HYS08_01375 [Chlamydiae bacterium]|nr:hypothetical protein [Chlamydiota bacterium]MBI3265633.1 hypothetical protein [Chlamydiota bacterium]